MNLEIAPFVVCKQRGGQLERTAASHHQQLGELLLDDKALLKQADSHVRLTSASQISGC
jgi:hypothetical protein